MKTPLFLIRPGRSRVGEILYELDALTGIHDLHRHIYLSRRALSMIKVDQDPKMWAALQSEIANGLLESLEGSRPSNLDQAIQH